MLPKVFKTLSKRVSEGPNEMFKRLMIDNFSFAFVRPKITHRQNPFIFQQRFCCKVPFICLPIPLKEIQMLELVIVYQKKTKRKKKQ